MRRKIILLAILCLLLAAAVPALAQVSANYDLSWHVVGGGGGSATSAGHALMGTVGQPLTGSMFNSGHALCSGFWCAGAVAYRVYLPLVVRNF